MLGVIINTITVILGSAIGLLCKKGIPDRLSQAAMTALGLCTIYIGIDGALEGQNTLVLILSMVIGTLIGTAIDLDHQIARLGGWVETRFTRKGGQVSLAEGFVTASLLFCVGAMTVVGSLNAGLRGDNQMLITKAMLDLVSSCMLAVSLGFGVTLAAVFVLVFQGGLVLLAQFLAPLLTDAAIGEMTCAGSVMILALGLNMVGIGKFKVANFMPALVIAPILVFIISMIPMPL